jgi:hypothetical protein
MFAGQHILLTNATRRPYRLENEKILVRDIAFAPQQTKKCDQETGEDQKGQ